MFKINAGKGGRKMAPTPPRTPSYVRGSEPGTMRAPPVPRIKPAPAGTTMYGKPPGFPNV